MVAEGAGPDGKNRGPEGYPARLRRSSYDVVQEGIIALLFSGERAEMHGPRSTPAPVIALQRSQGRIRL